MSHQDRDLQLSGVRLRLRTHGDPGVVPVICLPGLTANLTTFDPLGEALVAAGRQVIAFDLRGRGLSEVTGPGSYGWPAHAGDVLEAADALGASEFDLVGWSMGGHVSMELAGMAPGRVRRLVLIDIAGQAADPVAVGAIVRGLGRLGTVYPSVSEYLNLVRSLGTVRPWSERWVTYFEYDLEPVEGGVRARTSRTAALEDLDYQAQHDAAENWRHLTMPVLLVRAAQALLPEGGSLVPEALRDRFLAAVPSAELVEVPANHYGVAYAPEAIAAIRDFLGGSEP